MLSEALAGLTPQYRRLMEMLFFETLARPYTEVVAIQAWSRDPSASRGRSASSICVGDSPNGDFDHASW
jgi:hypothetical protein